MSVRKLTASLLTTLAMLAGFVSVQAQEAFPAADPFAFDPDFQWYKPVDDMDLAAMKSKKRASTGWFATYDRLMLYGSRPTLEVDFESQYKVDMGYGHRYEVGYMLPDVDNGWAFTWTTHSVAESFTVDRERLNRLNEDDLPPPGQKDGVVGLPFGLIEPASDRNNMGYNTRFYPLRDSLNDFDYTSYELNKNWRMEPYHYGGILEPMVGFRWMRVLDTNLRDTYISSIDNPPFPVEDAEQLITDQAFTENELITAQMGFRYTKFRDRFIFNTDFRVFTGGNFQCSKANRVTTTTLYDGDDISAGVDHVITDATVPIYSRNNEFVVGFDVRGELSYQLTNAITVRGGIQVIDIARGLWRGGSTNPGEALLIGGSNDQDLVMVGGTIGLTLNR